MLHLQSICYMPERSASTNLTSAINLLSNEGLGNQKSSIYAGLQALISTFCLFPLNRCRWFGSDVVEDPVDVGDLVDDADGNPVQNIVGNSGPVGGHEIGGGDGTEG